MVEQSCFYSTKASIVLQTRCSTARLCKGKLLVIGTDTRLQGLVELVRLLDDAQSEFLVQALIVEAVAVGRLAVRHLQQTQPSASTTPTSLYSSRRRMPLYSPHTGRQHKVPTIPQSRTSRTHMVEPRHPLGQFTISSPWHCFHILVQSSISALRGRRAAYWLVHQLKDSMHSCITTLHRVYHHRNPLRARLIRGRTL